jgi:hypothetical protein
MERHRQYGGLLPPAPPRLVARLMARLGEPLYRDDDVVVWSLDDASD